MKYDEIFTCKLEKKHV